MRPGSGWYKVLAVAVGLLLVASACGSSKKKSGSTTTSPGGAGQTGGGKAGGNLIDAYNFGAGEPDHIDPATADTLQGAQVPVLLYRGLTQSNPKTALTEPAVASSWKPNADASVWTFTLRKDVKFSNGEAVTPTSFKKAWERVLRPSLASSLTYHFDIIQGAKDIEDGKATELSGVVADDAKSTLTVTLTQPQAEFPAVLSHPVFSPLPQAAWSTGANYEQGVMIGDGPYMMDGPWHHNRDVKLKRNPNFSLTPKGKLDSIDFLISKDANSAYNSFKSGDADTGLIPPGDFSAAVKQYPHSTPPVLGQYGFGLGQDNPVLGGKKNLKLREAISMAINRPRINEAAYSGAYRPATGFTPPGVPGYKANLCKYCKYDPTKAKKLVKQWKDAGGKFNGPLNISFNTGAGHETLVGLMVQDLKNVGIPATPKGLNPDTWTADQRKPGGCQICRNTWIWDYAIYDNGIYSLFDSQSIDGDNFSRYSNKTVDNDIAEARRTLDAAQRHQLYQDAEKKMLDDVAYVPVLFYSGQMVYSNKLHNVATSPLNFINYDQITLG